MQIGSVQNGEAIVLGALDISMIDSVIKRNINQIRYCYQKELHKYPNLNGTIVVKFVVAADGSVQKSVIKSSTMGSEAAQNCVAKRLLRMKFPAPKGGGIAIVSYPFVFTP